MGFREVEAGRVGMEFRETEVELACTGVRAVVSERFDADGAAEVEGTASRDPISTRD
jgi:hypothetical protein